MTKKQQEAFQKWKDNVNMSKSELQRFYDSEEGKEAGLSKSEASRQGIDYGRESARWIFKMKDTPVSEWTPTMWKWAGKQNSFISRMSGVQGKLYDSKGRKTRKHLALLIWGHNPEKKAKGGRLSKLEKLKEKSEVVTNIEPEGLYEGALESAPIFKKGGRTIAQTPAPKKDRIYGSRINKEKSAQSKQSAKDIKFSEETIQALQNKVKEYNENHTSKVNLATLKAVYRRGAGAYSSSHRPRISGGKPNTRNAWAMARVNKFLEKKAGKPVKSAYIQDDDLLENGGEIENLMKQGVIELNFYSATPQHAEERGVLAKKPLYIQNLCVSESMRLKGIGKKVLTYVEDYATKNGYDAIFGYCDVDMVKNWLYRKGYAINDLTNEFHKLIKLADGSNTTFDVENPDIRYDDGGKVEDLISQGLVELKMFDTTPEHAKEYGLDSKKPLYVQSIYISKDNRLQGIGSKVIEYITDYAEKNKYDVIFGHITQKAEPNIDVIKYMLVKSGFNTCKVNNDFYKILAKGGETETKISLPDTYASEESLKRVLDMQGYELNKKVNQSDMEKIDLTISEVAEKHSLPVETLRDELVEGIKTEMEHTDNPEEAKKIALDHLSENPQYYQYLQKMEAKMKQETIDKHYEELKSRYADGGEISAIYSFRTPSGEPTRLTYIQQVLVRTTQFKNWFGDWEKAGNLFHIERQKLNNPNANIIPFDEIYKGVSNVLDMVTLEPKVVYHGTGVGEEFYQFDVSRESGTGRPYAYFADNREYSQNFIRRSQGFMYECFLNIKNPFMAISSNFYARRETYLYWIAVISVELHFSRPDTSVEDIIKELNDSLAPYLKSVWQNETNEFPFWMAMSSDKDSIFKRYLMLNNFDGIRYSEEFNFNYDINNPAEFTRAWCIFDAKQVKLADGRNITFNPLETDIRLADGGNLKPKVEVIENPDQSMNRIQIMRKNMGLDYSETEKFGDGGSVYGDSKHTKDAKDGGYFKGKSHANGGIKAINVDTGQIIEVEGNEVIINKRSVSDPTKREFEGEMLTNKEILSKINQMGGGVKFENGGNLHESCGCSGKKYKFGGETLEDYVILSKINKLSESYLSPEEESINQLNQMLSEIYG